MSILKAWVESIGLRQQGVLLAAVRGPDGMPKNYPLKGVVLAFRGVVLNPHCGDIGKTKSFMTNPDSDELECIFDIVVASFDELNTHYLLHLIHAAEVIAYYHPEPGIASDWSRFYGRMCRKMHLNPETREQLSARLDADEDSFAISQLA